MNVALPNVTLYQSRAAARAGGSSFYFAMRILGREQREAMFEIYSFCREVDDLADCTAPRPWRLARLAQWRQAIDELYAGRAASELDGLARAVDRYSLQKADFLAVIEGMEMDAAEDIRAPALERLDLYCDRVACAVGRLSVRVFGMNDRDGQALAHHLGRALQLTNILRDLDEDAELGRLYLPVESLRLAGIETSEPANVLASSNVGSACSFVAQRAREHFAAADSIMARSPRHTVRAPKIMAAVYRRMLDDMVARGWSPPRERVHVSRPHLLWTALRYALT
jgi:phytoene synthase